MNAKLILQAIRALDSARVALRTGNYGRNEEMELADRCSAASIALEQALAEDLKKIEERSMTTLLGEVDVARTVA